MLRSLYSGISGMRVNQNKLDVIGNNIANVGTTAYKTQRVRFQDMLSQNVSQALGPGTINGGVNPRQIGLGVQVAGIDTVVTQGMMQPTNRNLDVAVDGEGYLMVATGPAKFGDEDGVALNTEHSITNSNDYGVSYTRDGALNLDTDGNLLTSDGYRVMGYSIGNGLTDESGSQLVTSIESLQSENYQGIKAGESNFVDSNGMEVDSSNRIIVDKHAATLQSDSISSMSPAAGTVTIDIDGLQKSITFTGTETLDDVINKLNEKFPGIATKKADETTAGSYFLDLSSPTKGYGSQINILDSTGAQTTSICGINFAFPDQGTGVTGGPVYGTLDVLNNPGAAAGTTATATIKNVAATGTAADNKSPLADKNILKPLRIPEKVYEVSYSIAKDSSGNALASDGTVATSTTTDYKLEKDVKEIRIRNFSIDKDGSIKAVLDDGRVSVLGQISMATFKNPAGLEKLGKNLYKNSDNSGSPVVRSGMGAAEASNNEKGYGNFMQGMLEMSNVDLAEQFTDMIVTSRAFQASGKMISTGDEILQDIINLKR